MRKILIKNLIYYTLQKKCFYKTEILVFCVSYFDNKILRRYNFKRFRVTIKNLPDIVSKFDIVEETKRELKTFSSSPLLLGIFSPFSIPMFFSLFMSFE